MSDPLQIAIRHHQAGRLSEAEAHATAALRANPRNPVTLHLLGLIAARTGRMQQAVAHLERAASLTGDDPIILSNFAEVLRSGGQSTRSIEVFRRAIVLKPDHAPAHVGLAMALQGTGRADEALAACDTLMRLAPSSAQAHLLRAAILQSQRKLAEAIEASRAAVRLEPTSFQAHHHLGLLLADTGDLAGALATLREAERVQPKSPKVHLALGLVLAAAGDAPAALAAYERSLQLDPNDAETHYRVADLVSRRGNATDALRHYEIAIALRPNHAEAHNDRAVLLIPLGRLTEAEANARRAIAIRPNYFEAHQTLGSICLEAGRVADAIAAFRHSLTIRTDPAGAGNLLLALHYASPLDPAPLAEAHRTWGRVHGDAFQPLDFAPRVRSSDAGKIRIGYVSADFKQHSVAYFAETLLSAYERARFEVHCYSDVDRPDDDTSRLRASVDGWRETRALSDTQLTETIRADGVDILVDLAGHTRGNRLLMFARRAAPVQITYLGYPDTTGLSQMDYRLTDALADPIGLTESLHTETLLRIDPCAWCYTPFADAPPVGPLPAERNGFITFASFNRLAKISDATIDLWGAALNAVPRSRLLLKANGLGEDAVRNSLVSRFELRGIARDRVTFAPRTDGMAEHLATYAQADIALDTFPYHGTTTTCEALLMGLPMITLIGPVHASRVGLSLLSTLGKPEWATTSPADFVNVAALLADGGDELRALRRSLRSRLLASQLTDSPAFARRIEAIYVDLIRSSRDVG